MNISYLSPLNAITLFVSLVMIVAIITFSR